MVKGDSVAEKRADQDLDGVPYWQALYRKSLLRFFVLAELARRPGHGYQIASAVALCCDWERPADAMVYPMLRELEDGGYVVAETAATGLRERRVFRLTDRGRQAYRAAAEAWACVLPELERSVRAAGAAPLCCTPVEVRLQLAKQGGTT